MKVLVSDPLCEQGIEILRREPDLEVDIKTGLSPEELTAIIPGYEALLVRSSTKVRAPMISAARRLKVIGRAGVGLDNIDVEAASKQGVVVMNTPGGNTISTAEHTVAMILALSRFVPQASLSLKSGRWEKKKFLGVEIYGKTLGVVGLGRVGREVARRMRGFGMRILAYDPYISLEAAKKEEIEVVELEEIFSKADYITVHTPLTPDTRYLIGRQAVSRMKDGVYLINCARGGIIDEAVLCQGLDSGKIAGAALDVFEIEPPAPNHPLLKFANVIYTPHLGASTKEAQQQVGIAVARQVVDFLNRGIVSNAVNMPSVSQESFVNAWPYISLAEKLSKLTGQLSEGRLEGLRLEYSGEVLRQDITLLTMAALKGLLSPVLGESVNYVNAPVLARERGLEVVETKKSDSGDYGNLIHLELLTSKDRHSISGTLFSRNEARLVELDGFMIEAIPAGWMLIITNLDKPGVVGHIGCALGSQGINIGGMQLGREDDGGQAISIVNVDSPISEEVLTQIRRLPHILSAKLVKV